jgi:hypothetical protein
MGFKKVLSIVAVAALAFTMVGCGGGKQPANTGPDYGKVNEAASAFPKDLEALKAKYDDAGTISALGMATSADQITAMKKARLNATAQIGQAFENEVASQTRSFLQEADGQQSEAFEEAVRSFSLAKLHGNRVAMERVSKGANGYTAYVLQVLDTEAFMKILERATGSNANIAKATKAWDDLEAKIEKEKAIRAMER